MPECGNALFQAIIHRDGLERFGMICEQVMWGHDVFEVGILDHLYCLPFYFSIHLWLFICLCVFLTCTIFLREKDQS